MSLDVKISPEGRYDIRMESGRFLVRTAREDDVNERWAGWLNDPVATMMLNTKPRTFTLDELRDYVRGFDQTNKFLVCLYERSSGKHIGIAMSEFTPSRRRMRPAILIGEPEFRSVGFLTELEAVSLELYFEVFKLEAIVSHVLAHNNVAIAFNESRGWRQVDRLVGAKISSRTGQPIDILVYEFTRDMYLARKSAGEQA
jgi:RimJ/RimL family protein N-acetyltransferase